MLYCSQCKVSFPADLPRWRCHCGAHLLYHSESIFSIGSLAARPNNLWRYYEALGIADATKAVSMGEGFTPLVTAQIAGRSVLLKHDYLCPTGSFKDRGTTVMLSKLKEWGVSELIEDSSGNAGASVAAYAALAGIRANIYVPANASAGKIAQIAVYGANIVATPGSREDTMRGAMAAAETIFYASHNWNPYFVTGLKTAAYEIAEQLEWQSPDWVVTPVGGGNLLVGLYDGLSELVEHKLIPKMPRLVAVQAANCAPVYAAWSTGMVETPRINQKATAAEGIATAQTGARPPDSRVYQKVQWPSDHCNRGRDMGLINNAREAGGLRRAYNCSRAGRGRRSDCKRRHRERPTCCCSADR